MEVEITAEEVEETTATSRDGRKTATKRYSY
jgi:hypothetical protein